MDARTVRRGTKSDRRRGGRHDAGAGGDATARDTLGDRVDAHGACDDERSMVCGALSRGAGEKGRARPRVARDGVGVPDANARAFFRDVLKRTRRVGRDASATLAAGVGGFSSNGVRGSDGTGVRDPRAGFGARGGVALTRRATTDGVFFSRLLYSASAGRGVFGRI